MTLIESYDTANLDFVRAKLFCIKYDSPNCPSKCFKIATTLKAFVYLVEMPFALLKMPSYIPWENALIQNAIF